MRKEYKLTPEQKEKLLEAMKPVPYMVVGGIAPRSQQENANAAWAKLGIELGFDGMSVRASSKGNDYFTAETLDD